jgi:hypothetical protein
VRVYATWTEAEILLNGGSSNLTSQAQFHQFKRLARTKELGAMTSLMNKCENLAWAVPANATMEVTAGQEPYSLPTFITSDGAAPSGFTTIMGQNPTTEANWNNKFATYDAADLYDEDDGIIGTMDDMWLQLDYRQPPRAKEYFENPSMRRQIIWTNRDGRKRYVRALRASNDSLPQQQDPAYNAPTYNGIPVTYAKVLDTALLNSSAVFADGSPPYYWADMNYVKTIWHSEKFMQASEPMKIADKPDTVVRWWDSYCNVFCRSRARLGMMTAA